MNNHQGRKSYMKRAAIYAAILMSTTALTATAAFANPVGGAVSAGAASISSSGTTTTVVETSNKAVIDWQSFNIASNETTQFIQPSSSSIVLNRINSGNPSQIFGHLDANGNIIILNPSGVLFGAGSQIDVNGLIATTANISNQAFMANGPLTFNQPGNPNAGIVNEGTITAADAGLVGLVAPNVVNNGTITAKLGTVHLASADSFTVDFYGDGLLNFGVSDAVQGQLVSNTGLISAAGGKIALTAAAGNNIVNSLIDVSGKLSAPAVAEKNGKIFIYAEGSNAVKGNVAANKGKKSGSSTVVVDGYLDASGYSTGETGGTISVLGDNVGILNDALIDAGGDIGGGTIKIGGDFHGAGVTPTALNTYVDPDSLIMANAVTSGNGGNVAVWSDGTTQFLGNIIAEGGTQSGNGGFVETSGHGTLDAEGYVDLTASNGSKGTYLLDPASIEIEGAFTPDSIAGVQLWLDASQITGVSDGSSLSDWADLSGLGNNATGSSNLPVYQATGLNGLPTVSFGTASLLTAPTFTAGSIFVVGKSNNSTFQNYEGILGGPDSDPGNGHILNGWTGTTALYQASSSTFYSAWQNGVAAPNGVFSNINANTGWIGSFTTNTPISSNSVVWIGSISGGNRSWNGDLSEIIVYSAALGTNSRNLVEQYQSLEWGIPLTPPGTGATEAAQAMASNGYSAFTDTYLEHLSQTANIALSATGDVTLDLKGDNLSLAAGKSLSITAGSSGTGNINFISPGTLTTNNANITLTTGSTSGSIVLNSSSAVSIDSNGGAISLNGPLTLGSALTVNSGGGDVTFSGAVDGTASHGALSIVNGSGTVTFDNALGTPNALGVLSVSGTGSIDLDGDITTNNAALTLTGPVTLGADSTLNAGTDTITFGSTVDGDYNLSASAGGFSFGGALGGLTPLADVSLASPNALVLPSISAASILAQTTGASANLSIGSGDVLTASGTGTAVTLASGDNFINSDGIGAISLTGGGRWLIYSATPGSDTFGSLNSGNTAVWNSTYGGTITQTGDRYVFSYQPTVTFTSTSDSKTYGADVTTVTTAVASDYSVSGLETAVNNVYLADTDNTAFSGAPSVTSLGSATTATVAGGPYTITAAEGTLTSASGYAFSYSSTGTLTVNAASLTVTASNESKTYGATYNLGTIAFTTAGLLNSDSVTGATLTSAGVADTATVAGGPYSIVPSAASGSGLSNYTITYDNGLLTVNPAPLTITASNESKTYGSTYSLGTTAFTTSGLQNSDSVASATLTSTGAAATATIAGSPYAIVPSAASGSGLSNYSITYDNGALTVNTAPLTVTASDQSKTYGGTYSLGTTAFTTSGLLNSDSVTGATLTSTGAAATASVAGGPYAIVPSAASGSGLSNYTITYDNGSLAINTAPLTITASNESKTYGSIYSPGTTAFTTSGLLNSDSVTSATLTSTGAAATANVAGSPYAIVPSAASGSGLSNYTITYDNGALTVNTAPLTVTASDQSKIYGSNYSLGTSAFTTLGLLNSDSVTSATLTSSGAVATATVAGGPYAIVPSAASGSGVSNYTITYDNASLTVNTAPLTITADNESKTYGATYNLDTTAFTTSSLFNGDSVTGVNLTSTGTDSAATTTGSPYAIVPSAASGAGLANYTIGYVDGELTVNPVPAAPVSTLPSTVIVVSQNVPTYTSSGISSSNPIAVANNTVVIDAPEQEAPQSKPQSVNGNYTGNAAASVSTTPVLSMFGGILTIAPALVSKFKLEYLKSKS